MLAFWEDAVSAENTDVAAVQPNPGGLAGQDNQPNSGGDPQLPIQPPPPAPLVLPPNTPVPLSAEIRVPGMLSPTALSRLEASVQRYADDLAGSIAETERRERATGAESPEITA